MNNLSGSLSPSERKLLPHLKERMTASQLEKESGMSDAEVSRSLLWLANKDVLETGITTKHELVLGKNGKAYAKAGLPEDRLMEDLEKHGPASPEQLAKRTGLSSEEVQASIGLLKRRGAAMLNKDEKTGGLIVAPTPATKHLLKEQTHEAKLLKKRFPLDPAKLTEDERTAADALLRRKEVVLRQETKTLFVAKLLKDVQKLAAEAEDLEEQLTPQMLRDGSWQGKRFRNYDVTSPVPKVAIGRRHPMSEAANIIRDAFLAMGFEEMSGPWVETAFWCMDSMWIPQDHPARDVQDTFFIDAKGDLPDPRLVERVKAAHENGFNTGSTGHTEQWDPQVARQLLMRTHSTATTFRMFGLHDVNRDCKYFYIANNFRNEAVDATHLNEFLQAEGFIMADSLTLADLMGFVKEFYAKLGITKIRFKPTFNPYTEPSMEAHYYDETRKKWYALINSGIFRPEALAPYGITKSVIAWGMGATRIAAILAGAANAREIVGPACDIDYLRHRPVLKTSLVK